MSNQRISSLPNLPADQVNPQDLFIIVDRDSYASQNGQSKNITANDLVTYVSNNTTPGNTVEQTVYQPTHSFSPGTIVRMDSDLNIYVLASANTTTGKESEVAGIISYVTDENNFTIVYAGIVDFGPTIQASFLPSFAPQGLSIGTTYFLGDSGSLYDNDPTLTSYPNWISKPYLVGLSPTQGLITNYRPFFRPNGEEFAIVNLYITSSNSFVTGDAVRKTQTIETSSLGDWTLASADTYDMAEVIGVVNEASPNYFSLNLTGRMGGLSGLEIGQTYYLVPSSSINYNTTQSRNVVPDDGTNCTQFSKPVFVSISSSEIVILNQRTVPDKNSASSACSQAGLFQPIGPICYPGSTVPPTENVITLMNTILPNALNNSTSLVFWVQPVQSTYINPSNIVTWNLYKTENGWFIGN